MNQESGEAASPDPKDRAPVKTGRAIMLFSVAAIAIAVTGVVGRRQDDDQIAKWTDEQAVPSVALVAAQEGGKAREIVLPGNVEAFDTASIHGQVSGYVREWRKDIGAQVHQGDVLAVVDTPELDQRMAVAQSELVKAKANMALAKVTADRWNSLRASSAVSQQAADEKDSDARAKAAEVEVAQSNVDRMKALKAFANIVAPFDGVVTARNTDVGALINVGGTAGQELFVVSDTKKLRVYVSVPQTYVPSIPPGTKAMITVPDRPGKKYAATVESSSQAVNVSSGSTLMQLGVDNANGDLLPGGFANVSLDLPTDTSALRIPSSALLFDKNGLRVATLGEGDKIVLKKVTIARDMGQTIEIGSGLVANDRVVQNPPDGIADGDVVHVHVADAPKSDAAQTPNSKPSKG
jgi:RND family efflux transporter MFP subunit